MPTYSLAEIGEQVGASVHGDGHCQIRAVAPLSSAQTGEITFFDREEFRHLLPNCRASAIILRPDEANTCVTNALLTDDPYTTFAKVAGIFEEKQTFKPGIAATALIGQDCQIDASVHIGPYAVIGDRVTIKAGTVIQAHCTIGNDCYLSEGCLIYPQVTLYHKVKLGQRCIIHSSAVIGGDGFGYSPSKDGWLKIPQLGGVEIGDDVEIGSNTSIDRGTLVNTTIGNNVKIDNLVQIAHNVRIGDYTAIAACVGIAGSTTIGRRCLIAGKVGINGHLEIVDNVTLTGMTMVVKSIVKPGVYSSGTTSQENPEWRKNVARFKQLNEWVNKIKALQIKVNQLLES